MIRSHSLLEFGTCTDGDFLLELESTDEGAGSSGRSPRGAPDLVRSQLVNSPVRLDNSLTEPPFLLPNPESIDPTELDMPTLADNDRESAVDDGVAAQDDLPRAQPEERTPRRTQNSPASKRKRTQAGANAMPDFHSALENLQTVAELNKRDAHEFDIFCESLAVQLKKMPLHRRLITQKRLQTVMTNERLYQVPLDSSPPGGSSSSLTSQPDASPPLDTYEEE